ncbi:Fatty acyl-CoA synthetase and RNA processing-associated kinase 1 [Paraphaeosphaeria minitans]|uniref:non-specific serine/threonine protein kinase n=1 Tax=Paraphaeosphaeria minitans TaxID=565426 RepID=A0A9P6G908_9PLEO|nr:Fatty acyl-CoA synthetase and RNA processing-associated kinase 1 [Paraphaeosphaeria minitans]
MSAVANRPNPPQSQTPHSQQYYAAQPPASPDSRKPSRNGIVAPSTPQAHNSLQPAAGSALNTPRAPSAPSSSSSQPFPQVMATAAVTTAGAPMPPPRTSSHRTPVSPSTPRAAQDASQSRRKGKDSPHQQGGTSRSRPSPSQPSHSRSASAVGQIRTGTNLPREESTVINRLVVADPQEDIAREQARQAEAIPASSGAGITPITGLGLVGSEGVDDGGRGAGRSRQDHSTSSAKRSRFGNYILGQTLGEGEFGKVKMGWKKDSSVEVAIKLIRRETLGSNANRLQKIYREIHILRGLEHPNIVRLHEMVETERHIGIILEYASGGELFDYILNHRYLKDSAARRLFAQLISGVGYLHKRGIVHRDLKLENLLLDRNRNIIITDFGFANTFDANDELSEDIEFNLGNKDYIKAMGLEGTDAARRGDLMQTSCGSPCYAAPELVVSDSLYTGRKVDVWSCGVILYAMLAGYLPFDDDPANPEGDNINLLYKYIVSTPLTFPEYVTPHARDLLKRILVPDPRKRADLFEVARHSWLSDYAHVVSFITSSTTTSNDVQKAPTANKDPLEAPPALARSASVREPGKPHTAVTPVGGLTAKRDQINSQTSEKTKKDNKRRTVQVEYVAPHSQTTRGEASPPTAPATYSKSRVKDCGPTEIPATDGYNARRSTTTNNMAAPPRPGREPQRSVSDYTAFGTVPAATAARPSTGGTLGANSRLPSRGNSYSQPATATVAQTNVEGRFSQPTGKQYSISGPITQGDAGMGQPSIGQPSTQRVQSLQTEHKGHKRSNTVSETLGRVTSMFSSRQPSYSQDPKGPSISQNSSYRHENRPQKSYPPTSMPGPITDEAFSRQSNESSRRTSFGFSRKSTNDSHNTGKSGRRFSLLPSSLSKTFGSGHRESMPAQPHSERRGSAAATGRPRAGPRPVGMAFGRGNESRSPSQSTTGSNVPGFYDGPHDSRRAVPASAPPNQTQFDYTSSLGDDKFPGPQEQHPAANRPYRHHANDSEASDGAARVQHGPQSPPGMGSNGPEERQRKGVLQKSRKFADAYDESAGNKGSSGSSKRVMDFFRRMGRQRGKEDR